MAALLGHSAAFASSGGITGQSTAGCTLGGCHGDVPGSYNYTGSVQRFTGSVWTTTSTTISRNAALSIRYYLTYNSGSVAGRGGFDMTANGGTLSEADGTIQNIGGELTHTTPRALTGNDINFNNITWTAPNTEGTFTIFACGQPVSFAGDGQNNDGPHRCDTLAITVANNAPTVTNVDLVNNFTEGGSAAVVDSVITVADADGDNLNRAEVEITGNYQSGSDTLACPGCGGAGLSASFSAGQLNITGTASVATYDSVLQGVTFSNSSNAPSTATRTIAFRVRDTFNDFSADDTTTLTVTAVNDPPVISAPASIGVTEDVASALTGISFSDADATGNIDAAFSVGSGTLNAPVCTGVTVTGTSSARTLTGTPTNVNNCISGSNFTFTTASNVTTTVTLGISVDDNGSSGTGGVQSDTQNVSLTVTGVNDAPSISAPSSIGVTEDVAGALTGISFSDVDAGASSLTATFSVGSGTLNAPVCASVVTGGTATARTLTGPATNLNNCIGSMNLAFTTAANATADVALTVTLTDNGNTGTGGAQAATPAGVTLTVTAVNDAPVANPDTPGVPKNSGDNELDVLANDTDVDGGDSKSLVSVGTPNSGGSVVIGAPCAANTLCYTPATNFSGNETFTYTMQDGSGAMDSALVTVTVAQGVNPAGVNDAATVNEDSSGNVIDVLANDTDADVGDTKEVTHVNGVNTFPVDVGNGTVARSGAGPDNTLLYTPDAGYFGGESFTYTVTDAAGLTGSATVNVTVTAINDAPTLNALASPLTVNEDATQQTVNLAGIGSGAGNESQALIVTATSSNPALVANPTVTYTSPNATGSIAFTPVANASGSATITVTVTDDGGTANGGVNSVQRQFTFGVNAVNDAPTLNAIANPAAIDEDAGLQTINLSGIGTGAANETQVLMVSASSSNTALIPHPAVSYASPSAIGSLSYTPVADAQGSATITVTVTDDGGTANGGVNSFQRTFTATVNGVNDTPVIAVIPDQVATDDALFSYTVSVTDADGETGFTYGLTGAPAGMAIDAAGTITWTPPIGTAGVFTPTVEATDGSSATGTRAFQLTVSAPDSDSDGMPDSFETTHGLDPNDASDASEDADGDGVSNLDEYLGGTDPTTDDIAPSVTAPADLVVPATGYLTVVELGAAAAVDGRDGALTATYDLPSNALRPGRYVVTWTASDAAGNVAQDTQQVDVLPVVDITGPAVVGESTLVFLTIHLNGSAPEYPVLVDYTVGGTAGAADSDIVSGTFAIGGGLSVVVPVDIVNDGVTEPDETLTVTLTAANGGALGSSTSVTMAITDGPVTPHVALSAEGQAAGQRLTAYQDDGLYDLFAMASEMNGAPHSYDWSASDDALGIDGATTATPSIDPSGVPPGAYTIHVTVTDGIAPPAEASMLLIVAAGSSADVDADVDGIPDDEESVPGVPELLDNQTGDPASTELLETDAPLQLRRGRTSLAAGRTGALIAMGDIVTFGVGAGGLPLGGDSYDNVGGVFDFEVHGLNAGGSAHVVIPLQTAIRPGSVYRKFDPDTGWHDVVVDADNAVASAFSTLGHCPGPASDDYADGLQPFADCVRLTLTDGGPNDADGVADGVIRDPGGVALAPAQAEAPPTVGSGAFPALWLALAALLRLRRRAGIAVLALAAALVAVPARAEHHVRIHTSGDLASGFDNNVTNAQDDADIRESGFASGGFNADYLRQLSLYTTFVLRGSLQAEHWNSFDGLSNAKATVMGRVLYRGDGDFYTRTYAAWLSASAWEFDSEIRDSNEYRGGVFMTQHLTTQLQGRAALNASLRESEGEVFDLSGWSLSLNLDWAVAPRATVYTGYQFYDGGVTSTATPSLWIGVAAEAIEADDAFGGLAGGLRAYRLDATAQVATLGFNYALGRKLSADLQGQYISTRADARNHYERMVGVVSLLARF